MAAPDFPLEYGPYFPVDKDMEPRINVTNFGDGYEQRSGDGINIFKPTCEPNWEGLTEAEAQLVHDFFVARANAGMQGFMWRHPTDAAASKWVCMKWKKRFIGVDNWGISASFRRDVNPS